MKAPGDTSKPVCKNVKVITVTFTAVVFQPGLLSPRLSTELVVPPGRTQKAAAPTLAVLFLWFPTEVWPGNSSLHRSSIWPCPTEATGSVKWPKAGTLESQGLQFKPLIAYLLAD